MAKNVLHTDDCFINSVDCTCACNCNLTVEGKFGELVKENDQLRKKIVRLFNEYGAYNSTVRDKFLTILGD